MKRVHLPESKSMANRLLVLASFSAPPWPQFTSQATDIVDLQRALKDFKSGANEFVLREGGTSLRFLLARLSRTPGRYQVKASQRLLSRPHEELFSALKKLGTTIEKTADDTLTLDVSGWPPVDHPLEINCRRSTQFASAVLLSALELPSEFHLHCTRLHGSRPYLEMTLQLLQRAGLSLEVSQKEDSVEVTLPANQMITQWPPCEIDMSSAFSVAATAVLKNGVELVGVPTQSLQPDRRFLQIFTALGLSHTSSAEGTVRFSAVNASTDAPAANHHRQPLTCDLTDSPDLFPVLCALGAALGQTLHVTGLGSLPYKESDRLAQTTELLTRAGARVTVLSSLSSSNVADGLEVSGPLNQCSPFVFDPDQDHRMAMAAAVLKAGGVPVRIQNPEVVAKSLPEFWQLVEVEP